MDPHDAENILAAIYYIDKIKGKDKLCALESEQPARENARRSIVAAVDIPAGTMILEEMLTFKRPGHGISPKELSSVLGKTAKETIKGDTVLMKDMLR